LVCREMEWAKFDHSMKNAPWLDVIHASGDQLSEIYNRASVALMVPRKDMSYNEFAVSVKTFEYISYGLPIVAVNVHALSTIIEKEEIGITSKSDASCFADCISSILDDEKKYQKICSNIELSLYSKNLWKHRILQVIDDLYLSRNKKNEV